MPYLIGHFDDLTDILISAHPQALQHSVKVPAFGAPLAQGLRRTLHRAS
jgi:hypothetical protein